LKKTKTKLVYCIKKGDGTLDVLEENLVNIIDGGGISDMGDWKLKMLNCSDQVCFPCCTLLLYDDGRENQGRRKGVLIEN
jgi:hypothetical protein